MPIAYLHGFNIMLPVTPTEVARCGDLDPVGESGDPPSAVPLSLQSRPGGKNSISGVGGSGSVLTQWGIFSMDWVKPCLSFP